MRERLPANELQGYSRRCFYFWYYVVILLTAFSLCVTGFYVWGYVIFALGLFLKPLITRIYDSKTRIEIRPNPNRETQTDLTPMPSISSSIPQAPRPTPLHIPSMPPPPRSVQITPPTSPTHPTNDPAFRYPLSLSSQLSRAYDSHSSSFSSPYIASQSLDRSRSNSSTREWSSSVSPSVPYVSDYSHSNFTPYANVEAATRHAASLQPPAYLEIVVDDPGLPPHFYMTSATDEAPEKVFGPSNDGLPSYEAAMSIWQAPVDENPTPSDSGTMTND